MQIDAQPHGPRIFRHHLPTPRTERGFRLLQKRGRIGRKLHRDAKQGKPRGKRRRRAPPE